MLFRRPASALLALAACAAVASAGPANGGVKRFFDVTDAASFHAALALVRGGDTIRLADAAYAPLTVRRLDFDQPVTISGGRGARLEEITFDEASGFVLAGVSVTPPAAEQARVHVMDRSREITIRDVLVDGRAEDAGATITTEESTSDVTIRDSEITNCGRGSKCVDPKAANLTIVGNEFHDCISCVFVKGYTTGVTIAGNTFDRSIPGVCDRHRCPHNDQIAIFGGGPWTIVGNRFGTIDRAPAQIYVNPVLGGPVHDLTIESNLFADEAGVAVRIGVGAGRKFGPPVRVDVVNNTMLSGHNTAVYLNEPWADVPAGKRPLVANNVFAEQRGAHCERARFVSNLAEEGTECPGIQIGPPNLDPDGLPTPRSTLVIDRADPRYAPPTDFFGRGRFGPPDRGAFEFRPR